MANATGIFPFAGGVSLPAPAKDDSNVVKAEANDSGSEATATTAPRPADRLIKSRRFMFPPEASFSLGRYRLATLSQSFATSLSLELVWASRYLKCRDLGVPG